MATWIAHLRIAEQLLAELPTLNEPAFAFGSLAPDSGMPNANWTQFDPPKETTHFERAGEMRFHDLEFYRAYLNSPASLSPEDFGFRLGYFFHLLCDNLWFRWIVVTTFKEQAKLIEEHGPAARHLVKKDWYGLDHLYLRDHPDGLFSRVILQSDVPPAHLPFLREDGLRFQIAHIREYYTRPDPKRVLDRPFPYLNAACMQRFVVEASAAVLRVYDHLDQTDAIPHAASGLVLLSDEDLRPYAPPLGDSPEFGSC